MKITEDKLKELSYELYKTDWLRTHMSEEEYLTEYRNYILEKEVYHNGKYTFGDYLFDDYLFDNLDTLYVCYDEFLDYEYENFEYMKYLLCHNSIMWKAYLEFHGEV